jgi:hypothetical protein
MEEQSLSCRSWCVPVPLVFSLLALMCGVLGCSHSGDLDLREPGFVRVFAPQFPEFLRAPMGLLLTNSDGFSAQADLQNSTTLLPEPEKKSGHLLSRGSKLLFAPQGVESDEKPENAGGFMFIWDVTAGTGFMVSEALQGYAPVSIEMRVTNVTAQPRPGATQRVAGHSCVVSDVTMQLNDGTAVPFEVARATDLNNLAVQLSSKATTNSNLRIVTLSKLRLQAPASDLFAPPEGFTRYSSPEAMADEIAARKRNLRRGNRGALEPVATPPPGADHR